MAVGTLVFDQSSYENVRLPRPHPRRGGPQDVQAPGQRPRADPADGRSTAPTRCAGSWRPAARRGRPAGSGTRAIQEVVRKTLLTYWNTVVVPVPVRAHAGWSPSTAPAPPSPTGRRSTAGRCPRRTALVREVDAALEAFDTQRAGRLLSALRRRPVQLVRPPLAAPVLGRRPGGARDAARVPARRDAADGAARRRSSPSGSGRTCSPPTSTERPTRCTSRPGRRSTASLVDDDLRRADGAGPAAGRARPRRPRRVGGARPASRSAARWSPRAGWDALPTELRAQVADELNVGELDALGEAGGDLVDVTVKANFRALGKRFGKRHPSRSRRPSPPPTPRALAAALRRAGDGDRRRRRRAGRRSAPTRSSSPRPARGLGGGERRRRDRRARPRDHADAAARRPGPGGRAPGPGGAQERRPARSPTGSSCAWAATSDELAQSLREHGDLIAGEVLATTYLQGAGPDGTPSQVSPELGLTYWLRRA